MLKKHIIKPSDVPKIIKAVGSTIAYALFVKRDGSYRSMWFQAVIPEYLLAGGERAYNPEDHRISWVRDIKILNDKPIRSIRWDAVKYITVQHERYVVK